MTITASFVLFAVTWFMLLFIALPIRLKTQGDTGDVVHGTHASAPADPMLRKKTLWVTLVTIPIWLFLMWFLTAGIITVDQFDFYNIIE